MRQTLELQQRLQTTLTPELQQVLRIMQLSSTELQQQLQTECDLNPFLEISETSNEGNELTYDKPISTTEDIDEVHVERSELDYESSASTTRAEVEEVTDFITKDGSQETGITETDQELDWSDRYDYDSIYTTETGDVLAQHSGSLSLQDYLRSQARQRPLSDRETLLIHFLIDAVNSDGYLDDWMDIRDTVAEQLHATETELEKALQILHEFSPSGVGARTVQESLKIQLHGLRPTTAYRDVALTIIEKGFEDLVDKNLSKLATRLKTHINDINTAVKLIRSLNPRPGAAFADISSSYLTPDLVVLKRNDEWHVSLNDSICPDVKINDYYVNLIRKSQSKENKSYMKEYLTRARAWLYGIRTRNTTLLKTAIAIVTEQQGFFENGEAKLRPLTQAEIALAVGVHPSTISRITTQKFLTCSRGTFELKYFFSSFIRSTQGDDVSSTAIQAQIKKWTDNEDPTSPFSDAELVQKFRQQGVTIARRTITKYRQNLNIPSTRERRLDSANQLGF
ncbi:MAG: RNA polymerase factor sigma-54 [Gammaproteobacteria bacterium]|nr:RNA polymerase factor sigma-54 [Gammaproteobacteria bacterium]MDE0252277.1 RNA polymerase factor sigma-54 [Gammaproteobacteria bacterium]MDE0402614.1 RNA polymerase factor sigma-54 [Gammaproteobacteria bacterium]